MVRNYRWQNLGNLVDIYALGVGSAWPVELPQSIGPLVPGETAVIDMAITIPEYAAGRSQLIAITVKSMASMDGEQTAKVTVTGANGQIYLPVVSIP